MAASLETVLSQLLGFGDASARNHKDTQSRTDSIRTMMQSIVTNQSAILEKLDQVLANTGYSMASDIRDILAEVKKNSSIGGSIIAALQAQRDQIKQMASQKGLDADSQAILEEALAELKNTDQQMAGAVVAGTPAAPDNPGTANVKNDGPQADSDSSGMTKATTGNETSGVAGPGPDQEPKGSSDK